PLPRRIMADLGFDLGFAHPHIIIPGRIVFADMIEAKPIIKIEACPRTRRPEVAAGCAARMVARPHLRLWRWIHRALEASAAHCNSMGRWARADKHRRRKAGMKMQRFSDAAGRLRKGAVSVPYPRPRSLRERVRVRDVAEPKPAPPCPLPRGEGSHQNGSGSVSSAAPRDGLGR